MNRSRVTGNLSSHGILFSDITNDRVGIGSTIPTQKLDVIGNIRASGVEVTGNMAATGTLSGESLTLSNSNLIINGTIPKILFSDSDSNPDYEIKINGGTFDIRDSTNDASRLAITASGASITGVIETTVAGGDNNFTVETTSSGDPRLKLAAAGSGGHDIEYIRSSNTLNFKQAGGSVRLSIDATGHLLPGTDSQYNIGSSSVRFANIYADTLYGAGSNITALNGSNIASGTVPVARIGTGTKSTSTFYRGDGTFATVTPPAITTINSASNNRVVTSDGGTTVTAESTLTFDSGGQLSIGGSDEQKILLTGASNPYIRFQEGTTNKAYIQWNASGFLEIRNQEDDATLYIKDGLTFQQSVGGTQYSVWHSGNDGSGSGLDADTLDGIEGANFVRSDATDTLTGGTYTFSSSTDEKLILSGSSNPYIRLQEGTTDRAYWQFNSDGNVYLWNQESNTGIRLGSSINFYDGAYRTIWHSNNDGSGSGLDADVLRGIGGQKYLTSYNDATGGWEDSNRNFRVTTGGDAAGLVFHKSDGGFGFQLYGDGTAFGFLTGNWGNWDVRKVPTGDMYLNNSNSNKVWHAGNDGSGSGLDADTVDGLQVGSTANTGANQLVRTQGNGYINAGYINTVANDTGSGADCVRFYASEDAYIRYLDKGSMRAVMNTPGRSSAYAGRENNTTDQNYWVGSSGWGTDNLDTTVWDYGSCFYDVWSNPSGQPSGATHWNGFQAMHYTNGSARYGMRIIMGVGNPAHAFIQGRWNTTTMGWHKLWNAANDGSGSGLDADTLDGMQPAGLFSSSYTQTNQLQLRVHTNGWTGGIKFISNDGNRSSQIHMDNDSTYDLMIDTKLYVGGGLRSNGDVYPNTNDARDLGTSSLRWRNVYTTDLQLSNESKKDEGGNDVDGTWGDFTMQEGEDDLFLINNRSGKKYKFNLTEVS